MKTLIYVAGPLTSDTAAKIHRAIQVADRLLELGYVPIVPHLTHFWDIISPKPYEVWLEMDFATIRRCHALFRMAGISPGADREVNFANSNGIPVFFEDLDGEKALLQELSA